MVTSPSQLVTGDGRVVTVDALTKLFRNGVNSAIPKEDCDTLENIKTSNVYSLKTTTRPDVGNCIESVRVVSNPQRYNDLASVSSRNNRFIARLKFSNDSKKQLLEIWDRSRLLRTIDISEVDSHGAINVDPTFSSMIWCPFGDQDKLLYVCQGKKPKSSNFFKRENPNSVSAPTELGQEYDLREDWGDGLCEIDHTLAAVLDVSNDFKITTISIEGFSLAGSNWLDNGNKIVSVAYCEEPQRLGLIYCNNRPSKIVINDLSQLSPQDFASIESDGECFHTVRASNSGKRFLYLANEVHGAHYHSSEIHLYDIETKQDFKIVDKNSGDERFFIELPNNCFSSDDKHILFVRNDYLSTTMSLINLEQSELSEIKFPSTSVQILDFQYDIILAIGSELNARPTLFVAVLNHPELVAWHQIEEYVHLDEVEYESHMIPTKDGSSFVSALMVKPNLHLLHRLYNQSSEKSSTLIQDYTQLPTAVSIHGGPHANFSSKYIYKWVFYAHLGIKTLLINYRGSTGVDEKYLQSLIGKIGEQDVNDCLNTIRYFVQNKSIDPNKLIIEGGSHGGFLACHLSCQDEFKFSSAIIRNPVVGLTSLCQISDIPDWCFTEALGHKTFEHGWTPTSGDLIQMYDREPKFTEAKVPTLMLLGSSDRRVPMSQGLRWVKLLKAKGVETQCKIYQDKHDLAKPEVMIDNLINGAIWILSHL